MKVISKEPLRVATLSGAVVSFEGGVAREISDEIGLLAIQMGAKEVVEGTAAPEAEPEIEEVAPVDDSQVLLAAAADEAELDIALCKLMDEGDPENFTADGYPKAAVVNKILGKTIDSETRKAAWENILNS